MHAMQYTPAVLLQENQAQLDTRRPWAEAFSEYDHHQPCWKNLNEK